MRFVSKALGGGSGIGALLNFHSAGYAGLTNPLGIALAAASPVAIGARLGANAITRGQARNASALLRSESSLGEPAREAFSQLKLTKEQKAALVGTLLDRSTDSATK